MNQRNLDTWISWMPPLYKSIEMDRSAKLENLINSGKQ